MERFLKCVRNQRNLNSYKISKSSTIALKIFDYLFPSLMRVPKNTEFFDFRKTKSLNEVFFQNVRFHRSKRHL